MNLQTVKPRARLVRLHLSPDGKKMFGEHILDVPVWRVSFPDRAVGFVSVDLATAVTGAYRIRLATQTATVL